MRFFANALLFIRVLMLTCKCIESIDNYWQHFLWLFSFLFNYETLYMIYYDSDLLYGVCYTTNNAIKDEITIFHWFSQPNLISRKRWFKTFFDNFICFIMTHDFYDFYDSFLFLQETKLTAIVNWVSFKWA